MLGRFAEIVLFGLLPLMAAGLLAQNASAEEKKVAGEVSYRERIALPPNAVLTVELADLSLADQPAAIVAKQVVDPAGQVPIAFELVFDPAVVRPETNYALQARITVDDALWFATGERVSVDPLAQEADQIELTLVRQ